MLKSYEECLKIRSETHRGPYNLRDISVSVNKTLEYNEIFLESSGIKIICQMYFFK